MALEGYDEVFSMRNRDWLIAMAFCEDDREKVHLAERIADDTAERFRKLTSGRGPEMRSMMEDHDRAAISDLRNKIAHLAESDRELERFAPELRAAMSARAKSV